MGSKKTYRLSFRVNEQEYLFIKEKIRLSKCRNASVFLRKIVLGGGIVNVDTTEFTEMRKLISTVANNINQIAMRVNYQKTIYKEDITEIQRRVDLIWQQQAYILSLLHKLEH